ncbi:MAG: tetratricopeptide repeat protein [Alphaproteobacteria bacterium]
MRALVLAIVVVSLASSAARGGLEEGNKALERGDFAGALTELRPLAEAGDAAAQNLLGVMHVRGFGVAQDYAEAARWYRMAAAQGLARAQNNLGTLYRFGLGVPQDDGAAARWIKKAARRGYARAQSVLGYLYAHGRGVPKDYVRAFFWWTLAAKRMDRQAMYGREAIFPFMTPHQRRVAQLLADRWHPEN